MSMQTSLADGFRILNRSHSLKVAVPRDWPASTQDSLSEMKITRSPSDFCSFKRTSEALQLVPPPPIEASLAAFVITVSRAFRMTLTTLLSNGSTSAWGFLRTTAAATSAATSIHLTALVAPFLYPVTGADIEP